MFKDLNLFFSGQRGRFAQRSKSDNSLAAALYHPSSLGSERFVVDGQICLEWCSDGGEDSSPILLLQCFLLLVGRLRFGSKRGCYRKYISVLLGMRLLPLVLADVVVDSVGKFQVRVEIATD